MRCDVDFAIVVAVTDGVLDKIPDDGVEVTRNEINLGLFLVRGISELDLPVDTRLAVALHNHAQIAHHVAGSPVRLLEGAAHAAHLQYSVHEQQQQVALTLDDLSILALPGGCTVAL